MHTHIKAENVLGGTHQKVASYNYGFVYMVKCKNDILNTIID